MASWALQDAQADAGGIDRLQADAVAAGSALIFVKSTPETAHFFLAHREFFASKCMASSLHSTPADTLAALPWLTVSDQMIMVPSPWAQCCKRDYIVRLCLNLDQQEFTCPICMEVVESAPTPPRNSMKPPQLPFRTACCKQLFHRACLAQYRECAPDLAGCPLCRSKVETGLTPLEARSSRFRARTMAAVGGREAMIERHARARQAVQARVAAEEERRRLQMEAAFNPLFDTDF